MPLGRVIVVDDAGEIRALLRMELQLEGYDVIEMEDGVRALEMDFDAHDVVVLDVMMPKIDGFGVLAALRRLGHRCPKVILLTAMSGDEVADKALVRGAAGFMTKPFDPEALLAEVKRVMAAPVSTWS